VSSSETQSPSEHRGSPSDVRPLRVGILSTWNTRCGIAEYSRHLVEALRRHGDIEPIVLGSRNFGARAIAPYEDWATPVFDVQIWHPEHSYELDVETILELGLDVLHIQYSNLFYDRARLIELLRRFPGVTALTYHDKGGVRTFPHELPDLLYAHREDIGVGSRRLIPQGIDLRRPVVKTFGLGRSRLDVIAAVCERGGWDFQHSFGEDRWLTSEELFTWLRDSDAIVLWYDEDLTSGGSAGAPLAIGTRRPVFVNDTEWFRDLPEQTPNLRKLHTPEELERALRELFFNPYAEGRTWDQVAGTLIADYRKIIDTQRPHKSRHLDALRQQAFVALDHKALRRVLRRLESHMPERARALRLLRT
jgi:anaerobic selenocysteine-containing dehydrogenase